MLLIAFCTISYGNDRMPRLGFFLTLEIFYLIFMILVRPFIATRDNIIAIFNGFIMIAYISVLIKFDRPTLWTDKAEKAYLWLILSNSILFNFVTLTAVVTYIMNKFYKKKVIKSFRSVKKPSMLSIDIPKSEISEIQLKSANMPTQQKQTQRKPKKEKKKVTKKEPPTPKTPKYPAVGSIEFDIIDSPSKQKQQLRFINGEYQYVKFDNS